MTHTVQTTDHEIKMAIVYELGWTPGVNADRVGVSVNDGAVTLSGQVATYAEKTSALRAATRGRGVTAVCDDIVVAHNLAEGIDADIARDAGVALQRLSVVHAGSVKAVVRHQVITLSGTVVWQYQRDAIERAVASLPNVARICNTITLAPAAALATDAATQVATALRRNALLDAADVHIGVDGNRINLNGWVPTWAAHRQAEHVAWSAPGVTHVDNHLQVTP